MISIHAPLAGCDIRVPKPLPVFPISIHAPLAGRDTAEKAQLLCKPISIHAQPFIRSQRFQSTHPLRGATFHHGGVGGIRSIFQSTHPLRDATAAMLNDYADEQFQSTHPLRGATEMGYVLDNEAVISIHAPLAGCDGRDAQRLRRRAISIHAPLAGCD